MVHQRFRQQCNHVLNSTTLRYGVRGLQSWREDDGALQSIHLEGGKVLDRTAIFFTTGCHQSSDLSAALGCARDEKAGIVTDPITEESSVGGVYVAGDTSRDVLLVAVAIAEGAKAGVAINRTLLQEDGLG